MDDRTTETPRTDAAMVDEQRELATRLRMLADRLEQLPSSAAIDGLKPMSDQARLFVQRAERVIARAIWAAAAE